MEPDWKMESSCTVQGLCLMHVPTTHVKLMSIFFLYEQVTSHGAKPSLPFYLGGGRGGRRVALQKCLNPQMSKS